jgi:transposase
VLVPRFVSAATHPLHWRQALFLPKYLPDLNPIEQVFAKLKHVLRKTAARTIQAICAALGQLLGAFSPEECTNYFRNSGYPQI